MTIAICLKVGDGVVLGTDSASSLIGENDRYFNVYNTAEKTFNLVKGLPIGMLTFGLGGMAGLSIAGAPTVAPPIDIAAITRHQGFKWVERKHYYRQELNSGIVE